MSHQISARVLVISIAVVILAATTTTARAQTTWYADDNAPSDPAHGDPSVSDPLEDGSPEHPFDAIQEGIDVSSNGDTVVVADGTYTGVGNRDMDFGGRLITLRSENGADACLIDCQGSEAEPHRAFIFQSGENQSAVLDGLTISNAWFNGNGGAVSCDSGSATIRNCRFLDNTAKSTGVDWSGWGGAIFCRESAPLIKSCRFAGNRSQNLGMTHSGYGGALGSRYAEPTVRDCEFFDNHAMRIAGGNGGSGGAIGLFKTYPIVIERCAFVGNTAAGGGGALIGLSEQEIRLSRSFFVDNHASGKGGAIWTRYTITRFAGVKFLGNTADASGAVLSLAPALSSDSWTVNCLFAGNIGYDGIAGISQAAGDPARALSVTNATFVHNWGTLGAIRNSDAYGDPGASHLYIENCIVSANTPTQIVSDPDATTVVTFSDIQDGWTGEGNISSAPQFPRVGSGTWTSDAAYDASTWQTTFFDANASWVAGAFAGKVVRPTASPDPGIADEHRVSLIVGNTATTVTAWGDFQSIGLAGIEYELLEYRLSAGSSCIDAADNDAVPADELDLDGDGDTVEASPVDLDDHARVLCGTVDMGAYEFGIGDFDCSRTVDLLDFSNWHACMGASPYGAGCESFDFESDGDVDLQDYTGFAMAMTGPR